MNNDTLDGIPLSDSEKFLIRNQRQRLKEYKERQERKDRCKHDFSIYLGHGYTDAYQCSKCGEINYV